MRRTAATIALVLAATGIAAGTTAAQGSALPGSAAVPQQGAAQDVMFVGNSWEGTATVVDPRTVRPMRTIVTIPDRDARMTEILTHPDKLAFYLAMQ